MYETTHTATLAPVDTDDSETRGQAIGRRMNALGMKAKDLAREADRNRSLLYRVLNDEPNVREDSYRAFELALDRMEYDGGLGGPDAILSTEQGLIEFEVTADALGLRVVVKGPVEDAAAIEAQVARLIRDVGKSLP